MATLIEWLGYLLILASIVPVLFLHGILVPILGISLCLAGTVIVFIGVSRKSRH